MSKSKPELKLVEDTGSQLQDEDLSIELPPQQSEMPFAVVEGEPMTQLPRDLYIPPDALQVFLTAFEGPLDLLLYLIRKQNLDILNIPIAEITRQYMKYIEVMAEMQLELAGEYLLMAAMLAEIKSRMLLPRPATAEGTDEDDPRAELVRRLQEYERFKKAAEDIDRLKRLERDTMTASAELEEHKIVTRPPDVTLKEMLDAFRDVLMRAEKFAHHHISRERLSQRERMSEILLRLQTVAFFEFSELFKPEEGRMGVTVTFIAILELMKEGLIEIVQAEAYAPIHVRTAQRHLKVVQGGTAADAADAENVAALSQPELAGENDIPDEDETPPADEAAVAVQAAVADVAAASVIAADSVESDSTEVDAGFVDAAVSEALASTESAVDTIATEEAAVIEATAIIEESVVEVPVSPEVAEEAVREDALLADENAELAEEPTGLVDETAGLVDEIAGEANGPVENVAVDVVDVSAETFVAAAEVIEDAVDEHVVEEHVVEEHSVEEHIVPEHVVEAHEVPELEGEQNIAQAEPIVDAEIATFTNESVAEPEVAAVTNEVAVEADVANVVDEVLVDTAVEPVDEFAQAETVEIADAPVASADFTATDVVVEDAQPLEVVVVDDAPLPDTIEVATEVVTADETTNVAIEDTAADENASVVVEDAVADEVTNVQVDDVPADEITNVVIEDGLVPVAEHDEQSGAQPEQADQQTGELSVDDDTVTGSSSEADNTDAEPSR